MLGPTQTSGSDSFFAFLPEVTMRSTILLLSALSFACQSPQAPPADLVLTGGKIVTQDPARPLAEALAVSGDRIVAVGSAAEIAPHIGPATKVVALGDRFAMPGFIEGHGHFLGVGQARMQLNLTTATSWEDIVAKVAEAAKNAPPGAWILGGGWHQEKWDRVPEPNVEGFPLHDSLSAVSPDNPVFLDHASGHAVFVNAKAMELGGVTAVTLNPEGGEILKDAAGRPTGLFRETAAGLVARQTPPTEAELHQAIELASEECLRKGVTSFQDAGSPVGLVKLYEKLAAENKLRLRLWVMYMDSNDALRTTLAAGKPAATSFFKAGGIKHQIDGALGSRGAWLLEPYSDLPSSTGLNTTSVATIEESAAIAVEHGLQLCVHAIGDRANRETLDLFERTFKAHPDKKDLRWRVEHAQHLDPTEIPRFAKLGVVASVQAVHCTSDGPWVPQRLGEERSRSGAYVWRKLIDSGAVVFNGTDAPVEDVDPIPGFYAAVTRRMKNGDSFFPEERMTREEALAAYTTLAAYGAFEENEKGVLAPGKLADIVVLSQDLLTVPEEKILDTRVVTTLVGGKVVYENR